MLAKETVPVYEGLCSL